MIVWFPQDEKEAAGRLIPVCCAIEDGVRGDLVCEQNLAVKWASGVQCESVVLDARVEAASAGVHETVACGAPSGVESVRHRMLEKFVGCN